MRCSIVCLALAASLPIPTLAQPQPELPPPTVIELRPAAEPVPALKYQLVPSRGELVPGNAAIFYHRAIEMLHENRERTQYRALAQGKSNPVQPEEAISRWINGPLREIPRDEARSRLEAYKNPLHEIELGVLRQTCDWELDLRQEGFELLLPEMQEMRALGRLVTLRARLAVLEGKTDEAVHWIQTGCTMARHVSQGPTLIQVLVGAAITSQMSRSLEELIQAPGTPSLYWALAVRPRPFIDMTAGLEGERNMLERELPSLREINAGTWSLEQARRFTDDMERKLGGLAGIPGFRPHSNDLGTGPPSLKDMAMRLGFTAMVAKIYPEAKRALIAQGRPAEQVEAMPAVQVALLYTLQAYYQLRDDMHKWTAIPYWQSYQGINDALQKLKPNELGSNPLLAVVGLLVPAINSVRLASVRVDRQLDALECIEAIRLYAAAHGGVLPPSLEAITEAPAPLDPATGKPFQYQVSGTTATLSAPVPPGVPNAPQFMIRYELKLAR